MSRRIGWRARRRGAAGVAVAALLVAAGAVRGADRNTPLDEYVKAPDSKYRYQFVKEERRKGLAFSLIEMTSQAWRTAAEVDRPVWKHWVCVYRPERVQSETALLLIGGGRNDGRQPRLSRTLAAIAQGTNSVVAELRMVPNQPLTFAGDAKGPRVEDELVAYTWDRYLKTGDSTWPARLPMTKSAVRAMDTITSFLAGLPGGGVKVDRFVVAGGSKRGWTTWTTAAVDPRVVAIAPLVIDVLNLEKSMRHHYRAYGFWAPAIRDYFDMKIMDHMGSREFQELMKIEEPYEYRERFTMPKFIVASAGDQFFLPDSSQFYYDDLPGEKHLRYVPNSDHSLDETDAVQSLAAFYDSVLKGEQRPRYSWEFAADGSIRVRTQDRPRAVKLWQATNPAARDFRLEAVGKIYRSRDLEPEPDGSYAGRVEKPAKGWTAFFVELTYARASKTPFKFTTGVRVVPDTLPYPEPQPGQTRMGPEPMRKK